ncbi:hypothetical protein ACN2C6_03765 [Caulobacter sp. ErkDOM-YI]|uniref:hypothetical protein n=1 Tax=unclassified Caulobacter TaxID=2648921 RepID=UPI003AF7D515
MRILVFSLTGALALSGCATAPTVVRDGSLAALRGQSLAPLSSQSSPADGALAAAIQAGVLKRLVAVGADVSGSKPPAYLLQVGVGVSGPAVGVSGVAGPSFKDTVWRSAPTKRHFWNRRGPAHTATAVVLDVATGKPAAWATVRAGDADAEVTADRLVKVLMGPAS